MLLNIKSDIRKNLDYSNKISMIKSAIDAKAGMEVFNSPLIMDLSMDYIKVYAIEPCKSKGKPYGIGAFKVSSIRVSEAGTAGDSAAENGLSDGGASENLFQFYALQSDVEELARGGLAEPVYVLHARVTELCDYSISFYTADFYQSIKTMTGFKDDTEESRREIYKAMALFSFLNEPSKRFVRMRYGAIPVEVNKNGEIKIDKKSISENQLTVVTELCDPLIPDYIKAEIERCLKISKNKNLSETLRNIAEIRIKFYKEFVWGMPVKKFTVESGMKELSKSIFGRKREMEHALKFIMNMRKRLWNSSLADIYRSEESEEKGDTCVLLIIGGKGSGKELIANELAKYVSFNRSTINMASFGEDIQEYLGSSTIYQNSKYGQAAFAMFKSSDTGVIIAKNLDKALLSVKNAFKDIVTSGVVRDNNLECDLDTSKNIYIITADSKDNIPDEIYDMACVINLDEYTEVERLAIARDFMLPDICEKLFIDRKQIRISDEIINTLANVFVTTTSMDEVYSNLRMVLDEIAIVNEKKLAEGQKITVTSKFVEKCFYDDAFEKYLYDEDMFTAKFRYYQRLYPAEEKVMIRKLFYELSQETDEHKKQKLRDKLRFNCNYIPGDGKSDISDLKGLIARLHEELDKNQYGMEKAKEEIINAVIENMLANGTISGNLRLFLHGPAGVGKTMLAYSISKALDVPFIKLSLNGMNDPKVLKGFQSGYQGATLGILADQLGKNAKNRSAVVLLDEVEKAGGEGGNGFAIQNALFDILDPSEGRFYDNFLDQFVDTSGIIFIGTANDISNIQKPLLDRFKVINIEGYTREDRGCISEAFTVPKVLSKLHMEDKIQFTKGATKLIVEKYIKTGSVREIEKFIMKLSVEAVKEQMMGDSKNKIQTDVSRRRDSTKKSESNSKKSSKKLLITESDIERLMGKAPRDIGNIPECYTPGIVNCLAVRGDGMGCVHPVETVIAPFSKERSITGGPKEMIMDSIKMADVVVSNMLRRELPNTAITFSDQAIPKDGPSAGLSITISILSAHLGIPVPKDIAMTGEIDLIEGVYDVGGVPAKIDGARKAGIKTVYIPKGCYDDMVDSGEIDKFKDDMNIVPVTNVREVVHAVFGDIERYIDIDESVKEKRRRIS